MTVQQLAYMASLDVPSYSHFQRLTDIALKDKWKIFGSIQCLENRRKTMDFLTTCPTLLILVVLFLAGELVFRQNPYLNWLQPWARISKVSRASLQMLRFASQDKAHNGQQKAYITTFFSLTKGRQVCYGTRTDKALPSIPPDAKRLFQMRAIDWVSVEFIGRALQTRKPQPR